MPSNVVKSPADEKKWSAAKSRAAEEGHEEDWPYVMSIFNSMKGNKKESTMNAKLGTQKVAIHPAAVSSAVSHAIPMVDMLHSRELARRAGADSDVPLEEVLGAALMGGGALPFLATKMFGTPSDEDIEAQSKNKWVNFLPLVGGIRLSRRLKKMKNDARLLEEARTMERYRNKTSAAALDANALNHMNMLSGLGNADPGIASAINPASGMTTAPPGALQASFNLPKSKANTPSQAPTVKGASWINHLEKIAVDPRGRTRARPHKAPARPTPGPRPQTDGRNEYLFHTKRKNTLSQPQPSPNSPSLSSIGNDIGTLGRSYLVQGGDELAGFFNEVARRRDSIMGDVERFGGDVNQGLGVVGDFATDTYNNAGDAISELRNIFG